jgi:hypothetical protein
MSTRKKLTPEQLYAQAQERELLGLTEDGRLVLWDTGRVIPVSRFHYHRDKRGKRWIDEGHFVIDWYGSEVVAHLGNLTSGKVSVLLMCQSGGSFSFTRRQVTPMLRYKVISDPVRQRETLAKLKEILALQVASQDTPAAQRGVHPKPWLFQRPEAVA